MTDPRPLVLIPARMAATRLPGKPLLDIAGLPMIVRVWRQAGAKAPGKFVEYQAKGISTDMSFLEMLDVLNEDLIKAGKSPVAFDHDCREGICGS